MNASSTPVSTTGSRHALRRANPATALAVVTAFAGLAPLQPAAAAGERLIPLKAVPVGDAVLARMRGRYVSPTAVVYFGVEMNTAWRTATGHDYGAGLYIGVDRSGYTPTVTVLSRASGAPVATDGDSGVSPEPGSIQSGGLRNVQGVAQAVQVTGDTNAAHNQITLTIGANGQPIAPGGDGWHSGTAHVASGSGAEARTTVSLGRAGVTVSIPGQGIARQTISGLRGMQQQIQMTGDLNRVLNQTRIMASFRNAPAMQSSDVSAALDSIRNLPHAGLY